VRKFGARCTQRPTRGGTLSPPAPQPGRRISSRNTFFMKRLFPLLFFGFLALFVALPLFFGSARRGGFPYPVLIVPFVMTVVFFLVFRRLVFDLADEVIDEGDALRVRFGQEEERIPLSQISNVTYAGMTNPRRITLTLRNPGRFGREVTFSPQLTLLASLARNNALVSELIDRVDAARRR
jgi:hypothetical protein